MLLATVVNMEKCKDIPGVVALDAVTGEEFSADSGDYFMINPASCIKRRDAGEYRNLVLAVKACHWVDPISGEPLEAQIITEENPV